MAVKTNLKRIVVKVGTSTLAYDTGKLNLRLIGSLVQVLSDLKNSGLEVILVSSGAVGAGIAKLGLLERPKDTRGKQAAAAVGQCELMYCYDKLFMEYGYTVAQILLTRDIIEDESRKINVVNTFDMLLELGVIPIVNENDTVSVDELEITFGENDTLSAIVADITNSEMLIILSDIEGLFDADPRKDPNAKLIPVVHGISENIYKVAGGAGSGQGTGGMATKIVAAQIATSQGVDVIIAKGEDPKILYDILDGKEVGTHFVAKKF